MIGTPSKYNAVDGGFECCCGAVRQTPLGIERHRQQCEEWNDA